MKYTELSNIPVGQVKNVGKTRMKVLAKKGIHNLLDLITEYPRAYEDRRKVKKMINLQDGDNVTVHGLITSRIIERRIRSNLYIYNTIIKDDTGSMNVVWFNQPYIRKSLKFGDMCYFYGKVTSNNGRCEMQNPVFEKMEEGKEGSMIGIFPIYSLVEGLTQNIMRKIMQSALDEIKVIDDYLSEDLKEKYNLCDLDYAIRGIHFPEDDEMAEKARKRLVFDELLILQLTLFKTRNYLEDEANGIQFEPSKDVNGFIESLPFDLTNAQRKAFNDIEKDMESPKIMNRLVQGDVGSGKTIVALLAMLKAVCSGYQAAYMVPTEILAEQHFSTITKMLDDCDFKYMYEGQLKDVNVVLLKGKQTKAQREIINNSISSGQADIIIGTHAVIQESVQYKKLGLVITDEQHRFGVRQRATLQEKSDGNPDVLVMTATPIPRTLGLILYGDLDITIIDEMPKGRIPIKTYVVDERMRTRIDNFIIKTVNNGGQVYIVCPAVEEGETLNIKSAKELYEEVIDDVFRDLDVGLIYGKLKSEDKDKVMRDFSEGRIDVLISTTVIEVGVDVPNATLMVIENAERFGLAQLHQLRGRVGRGQKQSHCILYNQGKSELSIERMKILASTNDGFVISEKDLELRGPGEFFGTRQHGIPTLKIANLYEDIDILKNVQKASGEILADDSDLSEMKNKELNKLTRRSEDLMNLWLSFAKVWGFAESLIEKPLNYWH